MLDDCQSIGGLSNEDEDGDGNGNENVISKYNFLFS